MWFKNKLAKRIFISALLTSIMFAGFTVTAHVVSLVDTVRGSTTDGTTRYARTYDFNSTSHAYLRHSTRVWQSCHLGVKDSSANYCFNCSSTSSTGNVRYISSYNSSSHTVEYYGSSFYSGYSAEPSPNLHANNYCYNNNCYSC